MSESRYGWIARGVSEHAKSVRSIQLACYLPGLSYVFAAARIVSTKADWRSGYLEGAQHTPILFTFPFSSLDAPQASVASHSTDSFHFSHMAPSGRCAADEAPWDENDWNEETRPVAGTEKIGEGEDGQRLRKTRPGAKLVKWWCGPTS